MLLKRYIPIAIVAFFGALTLSAWFIDNETIETFVSSKKHGENEDIKMDISDPRKEVLEKLSESSPHGRVVKFISDKTTDIQVGITISETNKRICVVFRGSESKSDWYYDFMILKRKILHDTYADVHVHSGFFRQLHDTGVYEKWYLGKMEVNVSTGGGKPKKKYLYFQIH